jgi:hypothetical protein
MDGVAFDRYDDSIWDTWWVGGISTIDRITKGKRTRKTGDKKKNEHTKRSNKKHMGEI